MRYDYTWASALSTVRREASRDQRRRMAAERREATEQRKRRREEALDVALRVVWGHIQARPLTTAGLIALSETEPDLARALWVLCYGRGGVQPYSLGAALREARKRGMVTGDGAGRSRTLWSPPRWARPPKERADARAGEGHALAKVLAALWEHRRGMTARELCAVGDLADALDVLCPMPAPRRLGQRLCVQRGRAVDVGGRTLALSSRPGAGHVLIWEAHEVG